MKKKGLREGPFLFKSEGERGRPGEEVKASTKIPSREGQGVGFLKIKVKR